MPVILAAQEAEIRRIVAQSLPGQILHETLSRKIPSQKGAGGVAQGVGTEFKPQYPKKKKKKISKQMHNLRGKWMVQSCEQAVPQNRLS
jgi:hypothetical protein